MPTSCSLVSSKLGHSRPAVPGVCSWPTSIRRQISELADEIGVDIGPLGVR